MRRLSFCIPRHVSHALQQETQPAQSRFTNVKRENLHILHMIFVIETAGSPHKNLFPAKRRGSPFRMSCCAEQVLNQNVISLFLDTFMKSSREMMVVAVRMVA